MLQRLSIQDLAIIDHLEMDFQGGFTVLTGETGAGKSIILGALNLVLGERASADDVRSGCATAQVEALFDLGDSPAARRFVDSRHLADAEGDPANGTDLVVRREVTAQGRSRCLVNGRLVPLAQLRELGDLLVDLHGQHQHQSLLRVEIHRGILDAFAGEKMAADLAAWGDLFTARRATVRRLNALVRDERQFEREKDLLAFQLREIGDAHLKPGEEQALEDEKRRLEHAQTLAQGAALAADALYEGEIQPQTVADLLGRCEETLAPCVRIDPELRAAAEQLAGARAQIADAARQLRSYADALEANPGRLEEVGDRLHLLRQLKRKYGGTVDEILEEEARLEEQLRTLVHSREEIERLLLEHKEQEKKLVELAELLTARRRQAAKRFSAGLRRHLADIEMPQVGFEVRIEREAPAEPTPRDEAEDAEEAPAAPREPGTDRLAFPDGRVCRIDAAGADAVEFLIGPNPGEELKPLRKIASGGELSRIMLALKVLLVDQERVPTLVFDEIDTGISGRTGTRVGEKMAALGARCQVVCITHLPQIAARAARHFVVRKERAGQRTLTRVELLADGDRTAEIARLLGGEAQSDIARHHARALLRECAHPVDAPGAE